MSYGNRLIIAMTDKFGKIGIDDREEHRERLVDRLLEYCPTRTDGDIRELCDRATRATARIFQPQTPQTAQTESAD